jgi:hypothetical protein
MEGQRVAVYTTALGRGLYLVVIVPKGTKQGLVWLYAKEAAVEIDKTVQRATDAMQKQLGRSVNAADTEALHQEMAAQKVENVFEPKPTAPKTPITPSRPTSTRDTTASREVSAPREVGAPRANVRPLGTVSTFSFKKDRSVEVTPVAKPIEKTPVEMPPVPLEPDVPAGPSISFEEALKRGLVGFEAPVEPTEEAVAESTASALTPDVFAAALQSGLLDFNATPPEETPPAEPDASTSTLNPTSFEEALKRGLLNFGSDNSSS